MIALHHLLSFECVAAVSHTSAVDALVAANPTLRKVVLVWIEPFVFPALNTLSDLQTIRLFLVDWIVPDASATAPLSNPRMTFNSLTTLAINNGGTRVNLFNLYITHLSFPKLRVLNIHEAELAAPLAFDFVQRHPSLLEVTMSSRAGNFRLEAVLKLIEGTGTWAGVGDVRLDQPSFVELSRLSPFPPALPYLYGVLPEFSFSRVPIVDHALEWRSSKGSSEPRYRCSGLALRFSDDDIVPEEERFADMLLFLEAAPKSLREVQELHLSTYLSLSNGISFQAMMVRTSMPATLSLLLLIAS